jgi:hypothetical protein
MTPIASELEEKRLEAKRHVSLVELLPQQTKLDPKNKANNLLKKARDFVVSLQ